MGCLVRSLNVPVLLLLAIGAAAAPVATAAAAGAGPDGQMAWASPIWVTVR